MNKILSYFGLIKISRIKTLTTKLHKFYSECVFDGVTRDFGAKVNVDATTQTIEWWQNEFDSLLQHNSDDVEVITTPRFAERKIFN